ncbi:WD40-repeat-containing domain protein [Suillus spraguei]|nr:WD40-repeat-containing domain protein [Suillus spraguei]
MPEITPCQTMRGHTSWVKGVVHLLDGQHIITCSLDGSLQLWNLKRGKQIGENWRNGNGGVWSMALSSNGKTIASGGDDAKVKLWDVKMRKVIATWTGHSNVVCALCWSGDGERVASGSWDGTARVWEVNSSKNILTIKTRHKWVRAVKYSPDSSKLATGGSGDNAVKIWDAKTGELLKTLNHIYAVFSLAWTSDGHRLISGAYDWIRIFDTDTWQQIAILEGHTSAVTTISLSQNNRFFASVSSDKTARLWDLDTNLPIGPPFQHEQELRSAALSPDGKVLVTGCRNGNAYTWDVHATCKEAGLDDLLVSVGTNTACVKISSTLLASQDGSHTPRSSLDDKSFLEADATRCPHQFSGVDELSPAFFAGMEADVDSSPLDGAHSSVNVLLARLSSFLQRFRSANGEATELQQTPERSSVFHLHALLVHLSSLLHRSPPENDLPDELQQPSIPSRLHPRVLLAHLSSLSSQSLLNTDEKAEPHSTIPSSSHPAVLISRLSSFLHSQPHTNDEIELTQRLSRPPVVEVAAVRDKRPLVVAQGPQFKKAKRAYEQKNQSHGQTQASSSHSQSVGGSTSVSPPAPGTAAAQPPPISWWAQTVLFICCVHANDH